MQQLFIPKRSKHELGCFVKKPYFSWGGRGGQSDPASASYWT